MLNLIQIQDRYIQTLNAGIARWSHRPKPTYRVTGGHAQRTAGKAYRVAFKALERWGFTGHQISHIIQDARQMAELLRIAEAE